MALHSELQPFSSDDRAFNYGDGVFTTIRVQAGRVALYHRHVQRLVNDCERLAITVDQGEIERTIKQGASGLQDGVLKVLVSAGSGGRGYARIDTTTPNLCVSHHTVPAHYARWQQQGITVGISPVKLSRQPLLAGIKHLNRLEQVMIKQHCDFSSTDDVIVTDSDDGVIEASAANLFWLKDGKWYTPDLTRCGVNGVMRRFLLDWFVEQQQPAQIGNYHVSQLNNVEAMFLSNALMQIVPVATLQTDEHRYVLSTMPVQQLTAGIATQYEDEHVAVN